MGLLKLLLTLFLPDADLALSSRGHTVYGVASEYLSVGRGRNT
jgi:hypothetical protein